MKNVTHQEYYRLVNKYRKEDNFSIFNTDKGNICYVFFSSQGIFPNPWDCKELQDVYESGRYEWENISKNARIINNSKKIIFIRDIGKELYQRGINDRIDSISKLIKFIEVLTEGLTTYLVGSSSGGYISFIASQLRNVERVYSFGGLLYIGDKSTYIETKQIWNFSDDYISAEGFIGTNCRIIHSYGARNQEDNKNVEILERKHLNQCIFIPFDSDAHASRPFAIDIIKLLTCSDEHLERLKKRLKKSLNITQSRFSIINGNFLLYIRQELRKFLMKYEKKIKAFFRWH